MQALSVCCLCLVHNRVPPLADCVTSDLFSVECFECVWGGGISLLTLVHTLIHSGTVSSTRYIYHDTSISVSKRKLWSSNNYCTEGSSSDVVCSPSGEVSLPTKDFWSFTADWSEWGLVLKCKKPQKNGSIQLVWRVRKHKLILYLFKSIGITVLAHFWMTPAWTLIYFFKRVSIYINAALTWTREYFAG